ncbi:hypothetical protein [Erythrobacter rubeus]|uniref:PEGA domain-containing protein n=1 Tax=Erythrobacter rubeus TaxID=2760803 RepID=A0ABR8KW03_9SPHN|nr:hypothetical protein [Erythrobacter rubeus]MBD2842599.1 hypothetical protein [Erythrobacter rubeus]
MRTMAVYTIVAITLGLGGCAKFEGVEGHALAPAEAVHVATLPASAIASNGHGQRCRTPCSLPLLRATGGDITIALDGYHTERLRISSDVSDRYMAERTRTYAVEAIDPDPASMGLTLLGHALSGRGGVRTLETNEIRVELIRLAEGEEDLLAAAQPLTGERIPIDLTE